MSGRKKRYQVFAVEIDGFNASMSFGAFFLPPEIWIKIGWRPGAVIRFQRGEEDDIDCPFKEEEIIGICTLRSECFGEVIMLPALYRHLGLKKKGRQSLRMAFDRENGRLIIQPEPLFERWLEAHFEETDI